MGYAGPDSLLESDAVLQALEDLKMAVALDSNHVDACIELANLTISLEGNRVRPGGL